MPSASILFPWQIVLFSHFPLFSQIALILRQVIAAAILIFVIVIAEFTGPTFTDGIRLPCRGVLVIKTTLLMRISGPVRSTSWFAQLKGHYRLRLHGQQSLLHFEVDEPLKYFYIKSSVRCVFVKREIFLRTTTTSFG